MASHVLKRPLTAHPAHPPLRLNHTRIAASPVISLKSVTRSFGNAVHMRSFQLDPSFVASYSAKKPPFGFNGLGELVYKRSYARLKEDGTQENWYKFHVEMAHRVTHYRHETVERVVNGTYSMQKDWIDSHNLGWDAAKAQDRSSQHCTAHHDTLVVLRRCIKEYGR